MRSKYDIKELCPVPPPFGGCTVYVGRLIDRLTKDGFKIGGYYSTDCNDADIVNSKMFDKWTWMQLSRLPFKIWKYLYETWPYKIVHSHFSLEGMSYLWLIKSLCRKHIIVTVHNSMNDNYWTDTNPINRFFIKRMLKSKSVTWIAVSQQGKEQLERLSDNSDLHIEVVAAYVPKEKEDYKPLEAELEYYLKQHKKIISFYGHSFMKNEYKDVYGFRDAIQMYSTLSMESDDSIGMVICLSDQSDNDNINKLRKYAEELGVENKIYWQLGAIPNIKSLWINSDVYIRPTSTDGDSVAVREVLDEGAYVVASDVCTRPDGVICYRFGDNNDFISKVRHALSLPSKNGVTPNFEPYNRMKDIYDRILKK